MTTGSDEKGVASEWNGWMRLQEGMAESEKMKKVRGEMMAGAVKGETYDDAADPLI